MLYDLSTGAATDVTTGTDDTYPAWSMDGRRLAFERAGQIVVHDLTTGAERVVAQGTTPFWGGPTTPPARATATLTAPRSRRVASWRTLRGRTTNAPTAVQVAVRLRKENHCVSWTGRRFSTGSCGRAHWVAARLAGVSWTLKLKGLAPGRLTVRVRSIDAQGAARATVTTVRLH